MLFELLKAFAVGICAAAPVGPIAFLVMQKTLCNGRRTGFFTGLGSSLGDFVFALISILAMGLIQEFINVNQIWIFIIGGICLFLVGLNMARKKVNFSMPQTKKTYASGLGQAFACTLLNPGALAFMLAMVALFRLDIDKCPAGLILLFIFLGSVTWWSGFSLFVNIFKKSISERTLKIISVISGIVIILIGIGLFGEGLFELWQK